METQEIKIHANAVRMVICREYASGGEDAAIVAGHQCIGGLTDAQILKIAKGQAWLTGCTPGPIEYEEK